MKIKKLKKSCFKFLSITVIISIFLQLVSLTAFAAGTQKGDVNGDGKITLKDARMVLNSVALISILPYEKVDIADYDDDGILTTADAINILKLAIDLPPEMVELKYFKQMTPKSSNGVSGKSKFCVVKQENAETLPAKPINNTSNPLYTPLLEGTYDYIESG
ncbi:MAG: dockerin type I repeat-containing protein, partial [Clostridia bacterium]|nr:dockerin type I repeat-containing protein [Clostridia bacterium]